MRLAWIWTILLGLACAPAWAQDASEKEIERYRAMIADPVANPGYLAVDRGEQLWALARGSKNVSLQRCDLGMGPGVLEGAYAHLPRYFADTDKVMDLEQRLLFCIQNIQGLDTKDVLARHFGGPGKPSDMEDLVAFIANKSQGMKLAAPLTHPKEKEAYAIGEAMFYRRSSINDFACATCHGGKGQRIRLQSLTNFTHPSDDARKAIATWPAYRVSQSQTRTMQHRLWDCYRQMRMPIPEYLSDGITDLIVFLTHNAEGGTIDAPYIKR